jgi:hypothetical protein
MTVREFDERVRDTLAVVGSALAQFANAAL